MSGPRKRGSASLVDPEPLVTLFKTHWKQCKDNASQPWDLGVYNTLGPNKTAQPLGLIHCQTLLRALFTAFPGGIVNHGDFKKVFLDIATECKECQLSDEMWADWLATALRTAMAHIRRLANVPRTYQQRTKGLTDGQQTTLDELLALYRPTATDIDRSKAEEANAQASATGSPAGSQPAESPHAGSLEAATASVPPAQLHTAAAGGVPPTQPPATAVVAHNTPRRRLRRRGSTYSEGTVAPARPGGGSTGSTGIRPWDFQAVMQEALRSHRCRQAAPTATSTVPGPGPSTVEAAVLQAALTAAPRPAGFRAQAAQVTAALAPPTLPLATAKAKPTAKTEPPAPPAKRHRAKSPAAAASTAVPAEGITHLKVTTASQPERTYIQGRVDDTGKMKLITEVTAAMCHTSGYRRGHRQLCEHIVHCIERDGLDKAGATALRNEILGRTH